MRIIIILIFLIVGCSTNSKLSRTFPDDSVVISLRDEWRYHELAYRYGDQFHPPVQGDEATLFDKKGYYWKLDETHAKAFREMKRMDKDKH